MKPSVYHGENGFTLIELMVAILLAVVVGYSVFYMYTQSIEAYTTAEVELRFLTGFRASTNFIEREINSICWKGGYLPTSGGGSLKKINEGIFSTFFENRCMVFYTSLDGIHIDRVAYYFNPPEEQLEWEDGIDSDNDDPVLVLPTEDPRYGLGLLIDDKGSFMRRRWLDTDDKTTELPDITDWADSNYITDPAKGLPTFALPAYMTGCSADLGEMMGDGFTDVTFWYIYTKVNDKRLYYADRWPFDGNAADEKADDTGATWGNVGVSYLTVPLGMQIDFHYEIQGADRVLSKIMMIYSSKWQEILGYTQM